MTAYKMARDNNIAVIDKDRVNLTESVQGGIQGLMSELDHQATVQRLQAGKAVWRAQGKRVEGRWPYGEHPSRQYDCERDEERTCSVATVNRWRATLRKALHMARRWKLIQTVPKISRLKGERERSFVFTEALRKKYHELAPEPLNSFIQFSCEIGICEGEIIDLLKCDVHMTEKADEWGHYGYLQIRKGKTEFRKRGLPITARAKKILTEWMAKSKSDLVFTREDGITPVSAFTLIQQQERMRNLLNLPWDACVHSARHTALTNLGLTGVDPFTLQRAAGHANIMTTRKYVHPTPPTMKDAFQKKVRNERRDRRTTRQEVASLEAIPSNCDRLAKRGTVQ